MSTQDAVDRTSHEATRLLQDLDEDGNGKVTYEEFEVRLSAQHLLARIHTCLGIDHTLCSAHRMQRRRAHNSWSVSEASSAPTLLVVAMTLTGNEHARTRHNQHCNPPTHIITHHPQSTTQSPRNCSLVVR